ncbi:MAG: hypothetical protein RMK18_04435 [Armatimonadota bacterium]|nr:hypothetical protein [Armatimonadota bacterium]MCX7777428.1 hypothetical protein [Armatimonadota bacterium]MDW8025097.1 hypothetical protein [Armatimonadota bacterium]
MGDEFIRRDIFPPPEEGIQKFRKLLWAEEHSTVVKGSPPKTSPVKGKAGFIGNPY